MRLRDVQNAAAAERIDVYRSVMDGLTEQEKQVIIDIMDRLALPYSRRGSQTKTALDIVGALGVYLAKHP
jgi:hypothetical protein